MVEIITLFLSAVLACQLGRLRPNMDNKLLMLSNSYWATRLPSSIHLFLAWSPKMARPLRLAQNLL